jgi:uncharacterized protein (DUF111 family)
VVAACFHETTTIGLRVAIEQRATLPRRQAIADGIAVKRVRRPDGSVTAKAEIDAAKGAGGADRRDRLRRRAADAAASKPWEDES